MFSHCGGLGSLSASLIRTLVLLTRALPSCLSHKAQPTHSTLGAWLPFMDLQKPQHLDPSAHSWGSLICFSQESIIFKGRNWASFISTVSSEAKGAHCRPQESCQQLSLDKQIDSPSVSSWLTPALVSLKELQVDLGGSISEDQNPFPLIFLRKTNHSSQASVRTHPKPCTCSTRLPAALIRVSIAVIKYHEQKQLWRKGIISAYMSHPQSSWREVMAGTQGRNPKARTQRQELKQTMEGCC